EKRQKDLPKLEEDIRAEIADVERELELRLRERDEQYEGEIRGFEEASASGNARKADSERSQKARDKDFEELRSRAEAEREFLQTVWDTIRGLAPKQLVDDEQVWRELVDRYQEYFAGGMGAEAVEDLISRLDMDLEELSLKEVIAVAKGQRKAKAIKRLKVISAFNRTNEDGR